MDRKKESRVSLAFEKRDGSLYKRALICRTGSFEGMYGPCVVTHESLKAMVEAYQRIRANPANENDFAPVLKDHHRAVDLVQGRLLPDGMEVAPWKVIDQVQHYGLYATLRIDDALGQKNVDSGKYAHLSITFDEETFEIFEVSFVAVEAARGSIVLSKGEKKMSKFKNRLSALAGQHRALAGAVKAGRTKRATQLQKIAKLHEGLKKELSALSKQVGEASLAFKTSSIKSQLSLFVRQGKMTPDEMKKIDMTALAACDDSSLKIVLSSYANRQVSVDFEQRGQSGQSLSAEPKTHEDMRKAMALQRQGATSLAADDSKDPSELADDQENEQLADGDKEQTGLDLDSMKKCLEDFSGVTKKLGEIVDKLGAGEKETEKLSADDKELEQEEEKHLSDESPEKLAEEEEEGAE